MELKQHLKMTQQLVMTPQLQQAIKLLQLSRLELVDLKGTSEAEADGEIMEVGSGDAAVAAQKSDVVEGEKILDVTMKPIAGRPTAGTHERRGVADRLLGRHVVAHPRQIADDQCRWPSARHGGDMVIDSKPGNTSVTVTLQQDATP